jgi:hypothetical protein
MEAESHLDSKTLRIFGPTRAIKRLHRAGRWTLLLPLKIAGVAQW